MGLPNIGPLELIIILAVLLLIVGPRRLPEMGQAVGRTIREFRKASTEITEATIVTADSKPAGASGTAAPPAQAAAPPPPAPAAPPVPVAAEPGPVAPEEPALEVTAGSQAPENDPLATTVTAAADDTARQA